MINHEQLVAAQQGVQQHVMIAMAYVREADTLATAGKCKLGNVSWEPQPAEVFGLGDDVTARGVGSQLAVAQFVSALSGLADAHMRLAEFGMSELTRAMGPTAGGPAPADGVDVLEVAKAKFRAEADARAKAARFAH